jgi:hypothetical protein
MIGRSLVQTILIQLSSHSGSLARLNKMKAGQAKEHSESSGKEGFDQMRRLSSAFEKSPGYKFMGKTHNSRFSPDRSCDVSSIWLLHYLRSVSENQPLSKTYPQRGDVVDCNPVDDEQTISCCAIPIVPFVELGL